MISWVAAVMIGFSMGSAVNYLADVLPKHRKMVQPFCQQCNENTALINYLTLQSCNYCGARRKLRDYGVILACLGLTIWTWLKPTERLDPFLATLVLGYFVLVTVIDNEHRLIIHSTSMIGAFLGIISGWTLHGFAPTILGGLTGFGLMFGLYLLGIGLLKVAAWLGKKASEDIEALGFGDVILGGVLGLMVGWPGTIVFLILTIFIAGGGSLAFLAYKVLRKQYKNNLTFPYGPFMVLAAFILLFF